MFYITGKFRRISAIWKDFTKGESFFPLPSPMQNMGP